MDGHAAERGRALRGRDTSWQCLALAPSYASFGTRVDWQQRPAGGVLDCGALLATCARIAGGPPDVIAIDMPLSTQVITCRRIADDAIASAYGARGLGTHSPNATRPGAIARGLRVPIAPAIAGYPAGSSSRRY